MQQPCRRSQGQVCRSRYTPEAWLKSELQQLHWNLTADLTEPDTAVWPKPDVPDSRSGVSVLEETDTFLSVPFLFLVLVLTVGKHVSRTPFQECFKSEGRFQVMRSQASGPCNPQGQPAAESPPKLLTSIQSSRSSRVACPQEGPHLSWTLSWVVLS